MIINVSGRTDIVNYYTPWLLNRLSEGYAYSRNPFARENVYKLSLKPEDVDCLLFCSKNYQPILEHIGSIDEKYNILCNYTITAYGKDIEPKVPSINQSIKTLKRLSDIVGRNKILWRYDPILLTEKYTVEKHLETFEYMAEKISPLVYRCIFSFVDMNKEKIRTYDELEDDEKEVLDSFRKMKLMYDHARFRLHKLQVEDLINDYEQLKKLREEIQAKYFSIYEELLAEDLIEGELDASVWGITREHENEVWDSELRLISDIKTNFDIAIVMIENGEAEQAIIDDENR